MTGGGRGGLRVGVAVVDNRVESDSRPPTSTEGPSLAAVQWTRPVQCPVLERRVVPVGLSASSGRSGDLG